MVIGSLRLTTLEVITMWKLFQSTLNSLLALEWLMWFPQVLQVTLLFFLLVSQWVPLSLPKSRKP